MYHYIILQYRVSVRPGIMAGRTLALQTLVRQSSRCYSQVAPTVHGKREVVGYGFNGNPVYVDRVDFPMPAIRWKETTPEIAALREKEKGDWKKLTIVRFIRSL